MNKFLFTVLLLAGFASAQNPGHITGSLQTATGGTINNGTLTFTLSQPSVVSGTATLVTQPVACYTSNSGNIVGVPDPLARPILSTNTGSGTLAAGTYFVEIYYTGPSSTVSAVSPEAQVVLTSQGTVIVSPPAFQPNNATGYGVAISATSGTETIQGTVVGFASQFQQSSSLIAGSTPAATNNSVCNLFLSDELIPTGTYYSVNLVNKNGSPIAGYPQSWCTYGGSGATINVSQGAPTGNCNVNGVFYPTPILASPASLAQQSVNGPIAFPGGIVGALSFSGATSFTGTMSLCNMNTVQFVGGPCASVWGNGDIGSQINAAYAACPSVGCRIHVIPNTTCYSFTTPISFTVLGKPALLEGDAGTSCITYTPTTGTAVTLDWGGGDTGGAGAVAAGIRDITLGGPGSSTTAVGVSVGPSNGAVSARISGLKTYSALSGSVGFGTGLTFGSLGFLTQITNSNISRNGTGFSFPQVIENVMISDTTIGHNTVAGMVVQTAGQFQDVHLSKDSFDDNAEGIVVGNGGLNPIPIVSCDGCHFENGFVGAAGSNYVIANGGEFLCYGCDFTDDRSSGTSTQMITASGASFIGLVTTAMNSGGITITQAVNFSGNARGFLNIFQSSLALQATYNTSYTGGSVLDTSIFGCCIAAFSNNVGGLIGRFLQVNENGNPGIHGAGIEFCYADNVVHQVLCTYNNGNVHPLKLTEAGTCTMAAGTCTFTYSNSFAATPFCLATWNGTGTLTGIVKAVPGTSSCVVTSSVNTDSAVMQVAAFSNPN